MPSQAQDGAAAGWERAGGRDPVRRARGGASRADGRRARRFPRGHGSDRGRERTPPWRRSGASAGRWLPRGRALSKAAWLGWRAKGALGAASSLFVGWLLAPPEIPPSATRPPSTPLGIAVGLGLGAMGVRAMTFALADRQTLARSRSAEQGAIHPIPAPPAGVPTRSPVPLPEPRTGPLGAVLQPPSLHDRRVARA